jgi:hypothetical protein
MLSTQCSMRVKPKSQAWRVLGNNTGRRQDHSLLHCLLFRVESVLTQSSRFNSLSRILFVLRDLQDSRLISTHDSTMPNSVITRNVAGRMKVLIQQGGISQAFYVGARGAKDNLAFVRRLGRTMTETVLALLSKKKKKKETKKKKKTPTTV